MSFGTFSALRSINAVALLTTSMKNYSVQNTFRYWLSVVAVLLT